MVSIVSDAAFEQQIVDDRLVLEGDYCDFGGQSEHDMEVSDWQEISFALGEPYPCRRTLTLRAVPVAAGVVGDPPLAAILAGLDMSSQGCRATGLDGRHHLELGEAQMPGMGGSVDWPGGAEDVGDLDQGPHGVSLRAAMLPP